MHVPRRFRAAGVVKVKLYKGNVIVCGRKSPYSLYDKVIASFEDDKGLYNQADAGESSIWVDVDAMHHQRSPRFTVVAQDLPKLGLARSTAAARCRTRPAGAVGSSTGCSARASVWLPGAIIATTSCCVPCPAVAVAFGARATRGFRNQLVRPPPPRHAGLPLPLPSLLPRARTHTPPPPPTHAPSPPSRPRPTGGFIKLQALRLRTLGVNRLKLIK